jgi:protein-disulfide isomerase
VNTGKLRIVFKDYAFLSEDSTTAALWGRAVWDLYPDKYWEWRKAMYEAQDEEHGGFGDEGSIYALTQGIDGVNANAVRTRVAQNSAAYMNLIDADKAEGTSFGIQGTPGFITGKVLIPGALPLKDFKVAIDAQL